MFRLYPVIARANENGNASDQTPALPLEVDCARFTVAARSGASRRSDFGTVAPAPLAMAAALFACIAAACGDDSGDASETPAITDAGVQDAANNSSNAGSGGSTSVAPPEPVACGDSMCYPPSNPLSGIINMFGGGALAGALPMATACCLDESAGTCGISMGSGTTCEPPAVPDTRCPALDLGMFGALLGGSMQGCCIDNMCGQDGRIFGRGCVENSEAGAMLGGLPIMVDIPPTLACDRPMEADGEDAGVDDLDAGM